MDPHVSFISLGVRDVNASRNFYVGALGWPVHMEVPGEVLFIQVNHGLMLSLWSREQMVAEAGVAADGGIPPITLSHNVSSRTEVDAVVAAVRAAGADVVVPPTQQSWGGYSAYFADPDGFRWEVAHNPTWKVDDDGNVTV